MSQMIPMPLVTLLWLYACSDVPGPCAFPVPPLGCKPHWLLLYLSIVSHSIIEIPSLLFDLLINKVKNRAGPPCWAQANEKSNLFPISFKPLILLPQYCGCLKQPALKGKKNPSQSEKNPLSFGKAGQARSDSHTVKSCLSQCFLLRPPGSISSEFLGICGWQK